MFTQKYNAAVAASTSIFFCGSNALVTREPGSAASPSTPNVSHNTYSALASDYHGVSRDNGGGGNIGGDTLMVFSDTTTDRPGLGEFTSNSYAYTTNPNDPTATQDFGGNEVPAQAVLWAKGECAADIMEKDPESCTAWNTSAHNGWWLWPDSM